MSAQIAQLQDAAGTHAGLRPLLEEIRSDVRRAGPAALVKDFLGRDYDFRAYERFLVE